jgi:DNA-binding response OmpR family regulator
MGAIDYVTKPFRIEELRARLGRASRAAELQQEKFRAAADRALTQLDQN